MLAYIMLGSSNLKRSAKFYDAALAPLGLVQGGGRPSGSDCPFRPR